MDFVKLVGYSVTGDFESLALAIEVIKKELKTLHYIWHCEEFTACIKDNKICGQCKVGESTEDEWAVAKIIFAASKQLGSIAFNLTDQDGEFLLIEAAEEVPKWVQPRAVKNRVFIFKGKLCLIPPSVTINILQDALTYLNNPKEFSSFKTIDWRLSNVQQKLHVSKLNAPLKCLLFLEDNRSLIGLVTNEFCLHKMENGLAASYLENVDPEKTYQLTWGSLACTRLQFADLSDHLVQPPNPRCTKIDRFSWRVLVGLELVLGKYVEIRKRFEEYSLDPKRTPILLKDDSLEWRVEEEGFWEDGGDEENSDRYGRPRKYGRSKDFWQSMEKQICDNHNLSDDYYDQEKVSDFSLSASDYDIDLEVMEALKYDPDLFMKTLEMHDTNDSQLFIDSVERIQLREAMGRQKGMVDMYSKQHSEKDQRVLDKFKSCSLGGSNLQAKPSAGNKKRDNNK